MATNPGSSPNNQYLGETSSTCQTQSVTVAHKFQVPDFALLEGMGIGKHVSSCAFSVGDCDWVLNVYPDGKRMEEKGSHVSVSLHFLRGTPGVRVKFRFSLLDRVGGQIGTMPQDSMLSKTFDRVGYDCGIDKFLDKVSLKHYLNRGSTGGCFVVKCVLTVVKESRSENDAVKTIAIPVSTICQDLAHMLNEGEGTDVTFSVQGKLFPAHRSVLSARSPYFRANFFGPMKKKPAQGIQIDDVEPTIFGALLHFIYTDSLPKSCDASDNVIAQHLLVAADQYGLVRLRIMCEDKLSRSMEVTTVASTMVLAEKHHCVHLKDACLRFMATSPGALAAVMTTQGFKDHVGRDASYMRQILDMIALVRSG